MRLYTNKKQYNRETGKPENVSIPSNLYLCDYTGEIIDKSKHPERLSIYSLTVNQIGGSEESWYYDSLDWLFNDKKNNKVLCGFDENEVKCNIFSEPYHFFIPSGSETDVSFSLADEWVNDVKVHDYEKGIFTNCFSFDDVLRVSRVRVLKRALKDKKIGLSEIIRY